MSTILRKIIIKASVTNETNLYIFPCFLIRSLSPRPDPGGKPFSKGSRMPAQLTEKTLTLKSPTLLFGNADEAKMRCASKWTEFVEPSSDPDAFASGKPPKPYNVPISPQTGTSDLVFVFKNDNAKGALFVPFSITFLTK